VKLTEYHSVIVGTPASFLGGPETTCSYWTFFVVFHTLFRQMLGH